MPQSADYLNKLFCDIEKLRVDKSLNQSQMAEILEITRSHYNKVINQKTKPSLQLIQKMEEVINGYGK